VWYQDMMIKGLATITDKENRQHSDGDRHYAAIDSGQYVDRGCVSGAT